MVINTIIASEYIFLILQMYAKIPIYKPVEIKNDFSLEGEKKLSLLSASAVVGGR